MGVLTIISGSVSASIQQDSLVDDGCSGVKTVTVIVPLGTTKYVKFTISDNSCSITPQPVGFDEVISANKQYNMTIIGDDSTTPINSQITITVRQYDGGPLDAFDAYSRAHNSNIC